jgi:two-component system, NtrC family, nitrogen regulation sensor histidine kinase NtrY
MASVVAAEAEQGAQPSALAWSPIARAVAVTLIVAIATASYLMISRQDADARLFDPVFIALILVVNLVAGSVLLVLIGRAIARRRAARSVGTGGRLHVRLVAMFSMAAAIPMILVAITASLLFQFGASFWSSDRAQAMLGNTRALVEGNYRREVDSVAAEVRTMSGDLANALAAVPLDSPVFQQFLGEQAYRRELSDAMILRADQREPLALVNPYKRSFVDVVTPAARRALDAGQPYVLTNEPGRIGVAVKLAYGPNTYLYGSRILQEQLAEQVRRSEAISRDYQALQARSRSLQLRFNLALLAISLLIVGFAVWIALQVADRLVRPVGELVGAARQVADGDLSARVPERRERDELGTLSVAFNTMTGRIQQQNTALDQRRALIEAVMAGVSAGVLATGADGRITLCNSSAVRLLGVADMVGRPLADVAPALERLVHDQEREAIVQIGPDGEALTLAVRLQRGGAGVILTFDDITQQQQDQRRAAWSDVARRIAHEIKNPLTPIQLAAERLQRRYGAKVEEGDTTFQRLTDTIVRQVGDLRRMVDEFSAFARMPKPEFHPEPLVELARQALFLHEVAHPDIHFKLDAPEPSPVLVCDRRLIGQALTNLVKNAVEAIEARGGEGGEVTICIAPRGTDLQVLVTDDGVGLPADRERIVEPYVTTRARGTGLGLAIVKRIAEEHAGTMTFSDRPGGGAEVSIIFDTRRLGGAEAVDPDLISLGT